MKQTLFLFCIISSLLLIINCSNNENENTVHIFQVNSLRGLIFPTEEKFNNKSVLYGGISLISQAIVNIESTSGEKPIIIGNGNMYFGTPVSHFSQGKAVINVMNELHFDCLVIGHREFYFEKQTLINLSEQAKFPFLCANLVDESGNIPDFIKPYVILNRHGYKIGVIGVGAQSIIKDNFKLRLTGLKLLPIKETIDKYTKELKDKNVNYIIVSGDLNYRFPIDDINKKRKDEKDENEEISNAVSNKIVNAYLFKTREDILDKDNLITKCNGIVTVKDNDGNNKTVFIAPEKGYGISNCYLDQEMNTFKHSLLTINSEQYKPDLNIAETLYQINKNLAEQGGIILGFAEDDITNDNSKESMIGNLVTDALRTYCKTNIALINSGAITSDIKKGSITKLNVYNVYPYEDILHVVSLTGTQLIKILEISCNYDPYYPKKFLQLSGINFWYNSCEPPGFRIYLKTVKVNNISLDTNGIYTVVLPQFILEGRTGFDEIPDMGISTDRVVPVSTRYIIEDYIQKEHDIKIGIEKRSFDVHPECRGDK